MDKKIIIKRAIIARSKSYSPYSNFSVGAALLCKDGTIFEGANIENASYGLCMCAERNAIFSAVLNGKRKDDFVALAVVADTSTPCSPCGACRQVMSEFLSKDTPVYMANLNGDIKETTVGDLLPFAFTEGDLKL